MDYELVWKLHRLLDAQIRDDVRDFVVKLFTVNLYFECAVSYGIPPFALE